MTFNKFYASSVEKARQKAQDTLGKTYIVMETKEAMNGKPAWIHVLNEDSVGAAQNENTTYSRRDLFPQALTKLKETLHDGLQLFNYDQHESSRSIHQSDHTMNGLPTANGRQFQNRSVAQADTDIPDFSVQLEKEAESARQLTKITERFDRLEKLVSEQMTGTNTQYILHPAFRQLLASGVPQPIIISWFNEILSPGVDAYDPESGFMKMLAQKIKQTLDVAASDKPADFILFTGLSGSGKSRMIMKLAEHENFFAKKTCAFVTVHPAQTNFYSPLAAFAARQNIEHYTFKDEQQITKFKEKSAHFDHVFIEMPGLELQKKTGSIRPMHFKNVLGDALEVHRVINAALNDSYLSNNLFNDDNRSTDYIDFTHLDMIPQKGRLLPLIQKSKCKIRYVTSGPEIPENISHWEPSQFARELLSNA